MRCLLCVVLVQYDRFIFFVKKLKYDLEFMCSTSNDVLAINFLFNSSIISTFQRDN